MIKKGILIVLRLFVAAIMAGAGYLKLTSGAAEIAIFSELGMEPQGRMIIGLLEVASGLLLLSPHVATGALLTVGIMCGAIIAHATVIGPSPGGDGGLQMAMLALVLTSSIVLLLVSRRDLPLVGHTLVDSDKMRG
ncbi:MAG: DoxX family protein [Myxococcota bacterium]